MKIHILDDWGDSLRHLPSFALLAGHQVTVWTDHCPEVAQLAARLQDAEALILFRERTAITADLLARLPKLRLIAMRGAHPNVDVAACAAHGVRFVAHPGDDQPSYPTAELTMALILMALRHLPAHLAGARAGRWQGAAPVGRNLRGRVLGVHGFGRIGAAVAALGAAFGARVLVWGSAQSRARAQAAGYAVAEDHAAFLNMAEVVTLHLRLTGETRHLMNANTLAQMQPGAVLVNTSRAGLIDSAALLRALDAGRPGCAALDVLEHEPTADDPLLHHPRVLVTPHLGFVTTEELDRQFRDIYGLLR